MKSLRGWYITSACYYLFFTLMHMYSIHTPFLVVANVKLNYLFHVLTIWNVRPAGDLSNDVKVDVVVDDDDEVELAKSNILLMGPTGSGKLVFAFFTLECIMYLRFYVVIFQYRKMLMCNALFFESQIVVMDSSATQQPSFI
jgi:hypothetical protein